MKSKVTNNKATKEKFNDLQKYKNDKSIYFIYYTAGVIILAVFLNSIVRVKSTEEYYEKYYVIEDYIDNYEDENYDGNTDSSDNDIENNEHSDQFEENEDISSENNDSQRDMDVEQLN